MNKPYRWGDTVPPAVQKAKERRARRARASRLRQSVVEQGLDALCLVEEGSSVQEQLQAVLWVLYLISSRQQLARRCGSFE